MSGKRLIIVVITAVLSLQYSSVSANPLKEIFTKATEEHNKQNYNESIKLYQKALEIHPEFAPAYHYLGLSHKAKGSDLKEVIWLFKKATDIDPKYVEAYEDLSKAYYSTGDYINAEDAALKALELNPELIGTRLALAWIYLIGKDQPADAIDHFSKVTMKNEIPYAYFGLGMAYYMDHQRGEVLSMITQLRSIDQEDLASQLERMLRQGEYLPSQKAQLTLKLPQKQQSTLVSDYSDQNQDTYAQKSNIPVRIKKQSPSNFSPPTSNFSASSQAATGADRIRSLQKNSYNKGSGY